MKAIIQTVKHRSKSSSYDIAIGSLSELGRLANKWLGKHAVKAVVVSNPTVYKLYGPQTETALREAGFDVACFLIKDGEVHKVLKTVESALNYFSQIGIQRTDVVIALGGGVVGDLAGFAASIHLRGVPYVYVPTTLLAMIDSSVGGKTGVNSAAGKNFIGTFYPPHGVLIDVATLDTLPRRELTAGFCEAVKHGAVGGKALLKNTNKFLDRYPPDKTKGFDPRSPHYDDLAELVGRHVRFKSRIVTGDERESPRRTDTGSRKILNFGHTLAHALEKATDYKYFRHGEAVGYGIRFAAELSKSLALCGESDVKLLNDVVHRAGSLPTLKHIGVSDVLAGFSFDKKNLAGKLQMVLIKGIGKPVILTENEIPRSAVITALKRLIHQSN